MKRISTTLLLLFGLCLGAGLLVLYKGENAPPYSIYENDLYRLSADGCVYKIYSETDQAEFLVSGETDADVAEYVDKPVHVKGKFIYAQNTQKGKKRLLPIESALDDEKCVSFEKFGGLAVVISEIDLVQ